MNEVEHKGPELSTVTAQIYPFLKLTAVADHAIQQEGHAASATAHECLQTGLMLSHTAGWKTLSLVRTFHGTPGSQILRLMQ